MARKALLEVCECKIVKGHLLTESVDTESHAVRAN